MNTVALTGLRIDATDTQLPRFPLAHTNLVKASIRDHFQRICAQALVCSAACGTDLLALKIAYDLGMEAHVVLPFARERFRETSVVDRPGDWGQVFDQFVDRAQQQGRLYQMDLSTERNHDAYLRAVTVILDQAAALSRRVDDGHAAPVPGSVTALAVWDGKPHRPDEITTFFITEAKKRAITVCEIHT